MGELEWCSKRRSFLSSPSWCSVTTRGVMRRSYRKDCIDFGSEYLCVLYPQSLRNAINKQLIRRTDVWKTLLCIQSSFDDALFDSQQSARDGSNLSGDPFQLPISSLSSPQSTQPKPPKKLKSPSVLGAENRYYHSTLQSVQSVQEMETVVAMPGKPSASGLRFSSPNVKSKQPLGFVSLDQAVKELRVGAANPPVQWSHMPFDTKRESDLGIRLSLDSIPSPQESPRSSQSEEKRLVTHWLGEEKRPSNRMQGEEKRLSTHFLGEEKRLSTHFLGEEKRLSTHFPSKKPQYSDHQQQRELIGEDKGRCRFTEVTRSRLVEGTHHARRAQPEEAGVPAQRLAGRQPSAGVRAGRAGSRGRAGDDGGEARRSSRAVQYPVAALLAPLTPPAIINHYYTSLHVLHKEVWALSRIAYHRTVLQLYSPSLFARLQALHLDAELYAWDWFSQLFMGVFPLHQCSVVLDMLISVSNDDLVLVCLSVAIVDELRELIMKVAALGACEA